MTADPYAEAFAILNASFDGNRPDFPSVACSWMHCPRCEMSLAAEVFDLCDVCGGVLVPGYYAAPKQPQNAWLAGHTRLATGRAAP